VRVLRKGRGEPPFSSKVQKYKVFQKKGHESSRRPRATLLCWQRKKLERIKAQDAGLEAVGEKRFTQRERKARGEKKMRAK